MGTKGIRHCFLFSQAVVQSLSNSHNTFKDLILARLTTAEMKQVLEKNCQNARGGAADLAHRIADGVLKGAIPEVYRIRYFPALVIKFACVSVLIVGEVFFPLKTVWNREKQKRH
jgi:hypothetical protein